MKTVVTGGTGFIGSHLVKALIERGRDVVVASDFALHDEETLSNLGLYPSNIEIRKVDLTNYEQALKAVDGADTVFHLAARVGSLQYLHGTEMSELLALQTNLVIDTNVFKACIEKGIKKLIYTSSCAVYPMQKQFSLGAIFSESDLDLEPTTKNKQPKTQNFIDPDGGYGWAKLMGEIQLNWMKNVKIGIARIFNVYGENEPLGERAHAAADLIQKAILYPDAEFRVYGNGKQTRDFLYISDCIDALLKLEEALLSDSNNVITLNIGSGKATSIKEIVEKVIEISGKNIKPIYDTTKPVGPISRTADITKAKALLNWEPKISLKEGLQRTYVWIKRRLREKNVSRTSLS